MPELPEVEVTCRGIQPILTGRRIQNVQIFRRDLRRDIPPYFESQVSGRRVERLNRRGKYILFFLSGGGGFFMHLGMSGRVRVYHARDQAARQKHDHAVFVLENGAGIVFHDPRRFGSLYPLEPDWQTFPPFAAMGPEPLSNDFNELSLRQALAGRRTSIKTILLDQRIVAGVGNIYACEALYDSGLHPAREAGSLSPKECAHLVSAIKDVLYRAIEAGGSSLRDYAHADGGLGMFQHDFSVYGRVGEVCKFCAEHHQENILEKIVQAGRSTFYCPVHQK